jgi:hypothetical protein
MNTSRGKNEEHSKKMGQFDRVAFKQCGESLFDELFEFDRQLRESMVYANVQKNGSLHERLQINALELESSFSLDSLRKKEGVNHEMTDIEMLSHDSSEQIHINITDDVDDEAVYGRNRHRHKSRGR